MFHAIITGNEKVAKEQLKWAAVVEVLHVASLVHDDILDNSDERRGQPSLHVVYNKLEATFTGNYMIGRAYC
jgi:geranylgeranyl pyrophosphate synthase